MLLKNLLYKKLTYVITKKVKNTKLFFYYRNFTESFVCINCKVLV